MTSGQIQDLKAFNSFRIYLNRKKVPGAQKWASLIFDEFFDPSLAFPDLEKKFSIRARMIFPKEGPFANTRDSLVSYGVLGTHRKHHHDKHSLGPVAKKYIKKAYEEHAGMENDNIKIINELRKEVEDLNIQVAQKDLDIGHLEKAKEELSMWHDEKVEEIKAEMADLKTKIMEMLGDRMSDDEKEVIKKTHLKLVKSEDIS
jgi:hypothetical protein